MSNLVVTAISGRIASQGLHILALTTPSPSSSPSVVSSDSATPLPFWLLVALLCVIGLIVLAMFALTAFSLSAPRSTLKNVLGLKRRKPGRRLRIWPWQKDSGTTDAADTDPQTMLKTLTDKKLLSGELVDSLAKAARSGKRTTRTTLAIGGFSLLGVIIVAIFGLSGQGVRDLRTQVVASVTTLVASIAGFYFGSQAASKGNPPASNSKSGTQDGQLSHDDKAPAPDKGLGADKGLGPDKGPAPEPPPAPDDQAPA